MKNQFQVSFSVSVEVGRSHDRGKKRWWIKPLLIPVIIAIVKLLGRWLLHGT